MSEFQHIKLEQRDEVAALKLANPRTLNALNPLLLNEFNKALDALQLGAARALIITGEGRAFSSGADLYWDAWEGGPLGAEGVDAGRILDTHLNPLIERLADLPIPIVTAVNGPAAGAGCSIALCGDIVLAGRSAYFLQAFINIGLVPDAGSTWILPRLVGKAKAQAMMMLGDRISAEQAEAWGMIYQAVDDAELEGEATRIAERLAKGPTVAHRLLRQGLRECLESSLTEGLRIERRNQRIAGLSKDFGEGLAAFAERREPRFIGG